MINITESVETEISLAKSYIIGPQHSNYLCKSFALCIRELFNSNLLKILIAIDRNDACPNDNSDKVISSDIIVDAS